jgi:L-iditol 2-dehydrogenase
MNVLSQVEKGAGTQEAPAEDRAGMKLSDFRLAAENSSEPEVPEMMAAVYRGKNEVRLERVPVPEIGEGELLVKVHSCGICGTDLKKISSGSHTAPRIFGHETAGIVVRTGAGVTAFRPGDRVLMFHHIPCGHCFYCRNKVFAQCETYKKVGTTAGLEPSGGGFAEYVRVMDWIVRGKGVVPIPDGYSFERATFVEPVNTCLKAIYALALRPDETVLVMGQGPIGVILAVLARRQGATVITSDLFPQRLTIAKSFELNEQIDASGTDTVKAIRERTEGRGADAVVLAVPGDKLIPVALQAARPGGRIMLFAQTTRGDAVIDPAAVCVDEKTLMGSYSASVDLQQETVDLVFSREIEWERLISHRFPLAQAVEALELAARPQPETMKLVLQPGRI